MTDWPFRVSGPIRVTTLFVFERMEAIVKSGRRPLSVTKLWYAIECATPSGPDQLPDGPEIETERISLRGPELRLRSMRFVPPERPFTVTVPDSSSEPAIRRAVPERVTSLTDVLPCKAARDRCSNCEA